jgi:thiamine transport system ATP-binding protein
VAKLLVEDLTKSFGDVAAVSGVSFALAEREFLSLLGPSGCGKTTVLRLIAGFEEPDRGEISLDGQRLRGVPPELRKIGFVFQNYALFPHMTVAKNVAFGIRFQRGADPRQRTAELLEKVGLAGLENRRPAELSAGQRQRVALARALAPAPRLLLLDEPLSALDAKLRESLREELRYLQRELGVSTLYVTHDQEEALAVSDRIAVMNTGRIEQIGIPAAIYARPETPFVAAFIGRTNRLAGEVVSIGEEGVWVRVGESLFLVSGRRDGGKGSVVVGDRIVGNATLHFHAGPARHRAEVRIFLAKDFRGRGLGNRMLEAIVEIAKQKSLLLLEAEIIQDQWRSIRAFESLGFERKSVLEDYFAPEDGDTLDVVHLVKRLRSPAEEF